MPKNYSNSGFYLNGRRNRLVGEILLFYCEFNSFLTISLAALGI
jgi:hypothetical protein